MQLDDPQYIQSLHQHGPTCSSSTLWDPGLWFPSLLVLPSFFYEFSSSSGPRLLPLSVLLFTSSFRLRWTHSPQVPHTTTLFFFFLVYRSSGLLLYFGCVTDNLTGRGPCIKTCISLSGDSHHQLGLGDSFTAHTLTHPSELIQFSPHPSFRHTFVGSIIGTFLLLLNTYIPHSNLLSL